tara:strand:+ start:7590 stop:9323 length:1734 start_codon:yes stop_codon:yes gene_type:complete
VAFNKAQLEAGQLVWLLDLHIRGRVYRFSTDIVEVQSGSDVGPSSFNYAAGLEFLEYEDVVGLLDAESSTREVSVSVLFQAGQQEGWTSISDTSRDAGQASGQLSLHLVGNTHKQREIIVDGFLDSPSYGASEEPVAFTLQESDHIDPALFPPIGAKVDHVNWPQHTLGGGSSIRPDDNAVGQVYPWIFGNPGTSPPIGWWGQNTGYFDATPALLVGIDTTAEDNSAQTATLLLAGHEVWLESTVVTDNKVTLYNDDWSAPQELHVQHKKDGSNRTIAFVSAASPGPTYPYYIKVGEEIWVSWSGTVGGVINKDRTGPMRGAGEIISYLLEQSGLRVDTLRSRAPLKAVDAYLLDFWINEPRTPAEIISEEILPILPLSPQQRNEGLSFVYWRWDATAEQASDRIDIDKDFGDRVSPVEVSSFSEVYNQITIEFCRTGPDGQLRKRLTYAREAGFSVVDGIRYEDHRVIFNQYALASFSRYGLREAPTVQAPIVERDETAIAILDWMIRFHSQARRTVAYRLPQKYQTLEPGDVVTLTDSEIGFSETVCLVTSVIRAPGLTEVSFTTVPHWAADTRV